MPGEDEALVVAPSARSDRDQVAEVERRARDRCERAGRDEARPTGVNDEAYTWSTWSSTEPLPSPASSNACGS